MQAPFPGYPAVAACVRAGGRLRRSGRLSVIRGYAAAATLCLTAGCAPAPAPSAQQAPIEVLKIQRYLAADDQFAAMPEDAALPAVLSADTAGAAFAAGFGAYAEAGIEFAQIDDANAPLLLARIDQSRFEPQLLTPAAVGAPASAGLSAEEVLQQTAAVLIIGSPFVARYSPLRPLGLLQVSGVIESPLQPFGYTRVLGVQDGLLGVVSRSGFDPGLFSDALQVGPGIIEAGRLDISERETRLPAYFRSFVALCGSEVVVGVSLRPTHLFHVGQAFLEWSAAAGLACSEAVNLSGDRETLLVQASSADVTGALILGRPQVKKTALLAFIPRVP